MIIPYHGPGARAPGLPPRTKGRGLVPTMVGVRGGCVQEEGHRRGRGAAPGTTAPGGAGVAQGIISAWREDFVKLSETSNFTNLSPEENAAAIAERVGVSQHTIAHWIEAC